MIFNLFKKKTFNINCIYLKDKTKHKHLVKEFDKVFDAKNFLRYTIEEKLKELCPQTKTYIDLEDLYFKSRKYFYKIENDDFSEDDYVKQIVPRVYKQFLERTIDGEFKKFKSEKETIIFENIKNCEILEVNKLGEEIGIVYLKDNTKKFLNIEPVYHISSMYGIATFFKIDSKPLDARVMKTTYNEDTIFEEDFIQTTHDILTDIKQIVNIFHLSSNHDSYYRDDIIEIIYKNNKNITNSYRLSFIKDEDSEIKLDIKRYENIFSFKTRVLEDKDKTELNYSYDKKFFSPTIEYNYFEEVYDESRDLENLSPQITRRRIGDYYLDYPCTTFGKKIYFTKEDTGGILAYNISYSHLSNPLFLPNKEIYNYLNEEEKNKLHHFLAIAQLYLNDVYVNREFDNTFIIDSFINPKENERIEKLEKILKNCDWIEKWYYSNAEQGHPYPTKAVVIYHKEHDKSKNFILFNENDWISFKYTVQYNNNVKDEVEELLKDVR